MPEEASKDLSDSSKALASSPPKAPKISTFLSPGSVPPEPNSAGFSRQPVVTRASAAQTAAILMSVRPRIMAPVPMAAPRDLREKDRFAWLLSANPVEVIGIGRQKSDRRVDYLLAGRGGPTDPRRTSGHGMYVRGGRSGDGGRSPVRPSSVSMASAPMS
jgi:hypothetical protein